MSKNILLLFLLIAVVLMSCINGEQVGEHGVNSPLDKNDIVHIFRGSRMKREMFCWGPMVDTCCKNRCRGDGCVWFMCKLCC
uniref:Uncharacterized protein n=1 Tax=Panagrolaimus sp. JU765 TaxID=591449 RepID=A0AC34PWB8_9BILA